jgi:hypothetical protein
MCRSTGAVRREKPTYGAGTLWIVVIAVNRKYGQGDIQIRVFVIDRGETWGLCSTFTGFRWICTIEWWRDLRCTRNLAFIWITQKLDLNWPVT